MRTHCEVAGRDLAYTLNIKPRIRGIRLSVKSDGRVLVSMPKMFFAEKVAEKFVRQKWEWIWEQIAKASPVSPTKPGEYLKYKEIARAKIEKKVEEFGKFYNLKYGKVAIKRTSSRWGSCSAKKNLNFNYKLIFLPEEMMNYVVAHEICHLKELNHSKNFWELVSLAIPDYKRIVKNFSKVKI